MGDGVFGPEYPKINTVFKRDEATGLIQVNEFSTEEFEYLANTSWRWTEKVDGMNIRLHYDGEKITVGGRTDNAQIPAPVVYALAPLNNPTLWSKVFADSTKVKPYAQDVTIYGEGYGPKIQSGGQYRPDVGFIVFDVKVGNYWLRTDDVADVATQLGLGIVPFIRNCSLTNAIGLIKNRELKSFWQGAKIEGIVGTPTVPMFDRRGHRIIAKLKVNDFDALAKHDLREWAANRTGTPEAVA
jgi:RNA ligase